MFIGEGPGEEEDRQGIPFVGRAGQLLNKMLEKLGLPRSTVYIANIVKCRPPGNRDPLPAESDACIDYLLAQIEAVDPEVVVTLGRVPTQRLLESAKPIHALRGRVFPFGSRKLVPTYHPSYLLRYPAARWETWEDMKVVLGLLGLPDPG
jgi:DNA polymerase